MIVPPQDKSRSSRFVAAVVVAVIAVLMFGLHGSAHLRAVGLLLRIENPANPHWIARWTASPVEETLTEVPILGGTIRARLYVPKSNPDAPGMVIVHGLHHLGIDEPRLVAFSRAISASGIRVLTPELLSLTDYKVDHASVDLIGDSARFLSRMAGKKVGMLGLSFAGGLSLIAAADPRYAPYVSFVLAMGAHDDLERVCRFLVTNRIQRPDGSVLEMKAHEYGALILIYSHVEDFFPTQDVSAAHEALRLLLWEKPEESKKITEGLSPESRKKMDLLYDHHQDELAGEIEASITRHRADMVPVSPHGRIGGLHVPVLLLHGSDDSVVPPSELLWLKQDVPRQQLRASLISPIFTHVDMRSRPALSDTLQLVQFMAQIFELTDGEEAVAK